MIRIFRAKMPISSMYDNNPETGEFKVRRGTIRDIEFWFGKFSFGFSFVIWSEME